MSDDASTVEFLSREREPRILLRAITEALRVLAQGGDQVAALQESFTLARDGLKAEKGLLLYVQHQSPEVTLEIIHSYGLTYEQQQACREMRSVAAEGVSPSVIKTAIETRQPVYIPSTADSGDKWATTSLAGAHSVLCAPVFDPATQIPIAVLYFQNKGVIKTFEQEDLAWLTAYGIALSQGFGLHLSRRAKIQQLEDEVRRGAPEVIGDSVWTEQLVEYLGRLLPATAVENPKPILLVGPSGSGKEVVARYVHHYAPTRAKHPFIPVNMAELSGDLAGSRLQGHTRGSFTGAITDSPGHFRSANKGVLFLDEIGEMPLDKQALLLRVLELREVQPVGESRTHKVDVQVIAATNRDLDAMVKAGTFREDLLMRLRAFQVKLLPLADSRRRSDIRPLLSFFIARHEKAMHKKLAGLTPAASQALLAYSWPGNVREIDNVCSSLVTFASEGARIDIADIEMSCAYVLSGDKVPDVAELVGADDIAFDEAVARFQRELIRRRIEIHRGNFAATARSLGMKSANRLLHLRMKLGLMGPGEIGEVADDESLSDEDSQES